MYFKQIIETQDFFKYFNLVFTDLNNFVLLCSVINEKLFFLN
jgi:hypothetical protein